MKKTCIVFMVIQMAFFLIFGLLLAYGEESGAARTVSPSVYTVAFGHSYNGTTNVRGSIFYLQKGSAADSLEGNAAFCFDTSRSHMPTGTVYSFLGFAQDYPGEWDVETGYRCILEAEHILPKTEYEELTEEMKLFAVQVAVRKQQLIGPYAGVPADAPADIVCNERQSELMIRLVNEIVGAGLACTRCLPEKFQTMEIVKIKGDYQEGKDYILGVYHASRSDQTVSEILPAEGTTEGVVAETDGQRVTVRIPLALARGKITWNLRGKGSCLVKSMLLFASASSDAQRLVMLDSCAVAAEATLRGETRFYGLTINKKDAESGRLITEGSAVFRIKNCGTGEYAEYGGVSEFATVDGKLTLPEILPAGEYEAEEVRAPAGYISGKPVRIRLPEEKEKDISNTGQKARIEIEKKGPAFIGVEQTPSAYGIVRRPVFQDGPLSEVRFAVLNEQGERVAEAVTDEKGRAVIDGLPLGRYTVTEVSAPPGYVRGTERIRVVTDAAQPSTELSLYNSYARACVAVVKLAQVRQQTEREENGVVRIGRRSSYRPMDGFVFGLFAGEDLGEALHAGDLVSLGTTDRAGKVLFEGQFPLGKYYIRELRSAAGYRADPQNYPVDLTRQLTVSLEVQNDLEEYPVPIRKLLADRDVPGAGAVIEIFSAEGALLYREVTDERGLLPDIFLAPGEYSMREVSAPAGYACSPDRGFFRVEEGGTVSGETVMRNHPAVFRGHKTDQRGSPLAGAEFVLCDAAGNPVMTAVSSAQGEFSFEGFLPGRYTVREKKAPDGYLLSEEICTFECDGTWLNEAAYASHSWTNTEQPVSPPVPRAPATGDKTEPQLFVLTASLALMGIVSLGSVMRKKE